MLSGPSHSRRDEAPSSTLQEAFADFEEGVYDEGAAASKLVADEE